MLFETDDRNSLSHEQLPPEFGDMFPDPLVVMDLTSKEFVQTNQAFSSILLVDAHHNFEKLLQSLHCDSKPLLKNYVEKITRSDYQSSESVVILAKSKDGVWLWLLVKAKVIKRIDKIPVQALITFTNISQYVESQNKLLTTNGQLQSFKDALDKSAAVTITDSQGHFTYVNQKFLELTQYELQEILGKHESIVNKQPSDIENQTDQKQFKKSQKSVLEYNAKDNQAIWLDNTTIPIQNYGNGDPQYLSIGYDITDYISTKRAMDLQNQELDEFAYIVSHDLKAPLRGIYSLVDWIEEDMGQDESKVLKNLGLLKNRVAQLDSLINGVLQYTKVGKEKLKPEMVDIKELTDGIVDSLKDSKQFDWYAPQDLPVIRSYRILLHQVFANLITNAVSHNDKKSVTVKLEYSGNGNVYQFSISDNGPGVPEHVQGKIFQIFHTLNKSSKENTGIGLSIVRKIIKKLNGQISVSNNSPDVGCTFVFSLAEA